MSSQVVSECLRKPYERVIIPDDEGHYGARILEFPGCFSEGGSPGEAYANLQHAAENWLDSALAQGMTIPEPFASQGYSGTVSLRLPKSMHRRAAEYAHRDGVSLNQFLVSAIAARVGAEDVGSTIAARLDERLDRLTSGGPYLMRGVVEFNQFAINAAPSRVELPGKQLSRLAEATTPRGQQFIIAEGDTRDG
jgi:antitoxin HicB